jgi:hypothetical protein
MHRPPEKDSLDQALCRVHEIFLDDPSEAAYAELSELLPALVEAGYVTESDYGDGWSLWGFTPAGIARGEELGCV